MEMTERIKAKMGMAKAWLQDAFGKTNEELIAILRDRKGAILGPMRKLNQEQSEFSPGEGEWSTHEVGRHVAGAHTNVSGLMQMLAAGQTMEGNPTPGVVPEGPEEFSGVCDELERSFNQLEEAFEKVCGEGAKLEATQEHPWFGDMNARQWFVFCSLHTTAHIDQIERIAGAEGFPQA